MNGQFHPVRTFAEAGSGDGKADKSDLCSTIRGAEWNFDNSDAPRRSASSRKRSLMPAQTAPIVTGRSQQFSAMKG